MNCLLHVPKRRIPGVLAEISRVLKPDGLFYWGYMAERIRRAFSFQLSILQYQYPVRVLSEGVGGVNWIFQIDEKNPLFQATIGSFWMSAYIALVRRMRTLGSSGLGLAMGGGGITGCSHVGVIRALEEEGIPIGYVAGTSAGAMVAALYASGFDGRKLSELVPALTKRIIDFDYGGLFSRMVLGRPCIGMVQGRKLRHFLKEHIGGKTMRDMHIPLAITATDLQSGGQVLFASTSLLPIYTGPRTEVIHDAGLLDVVLASMAIPGLFRPVQMGNRMLVDGGLSDNCPSAPLKAMGAQRVLAVNLVSVRPIRHPLKFYTSVVTRSLSIGLNRMSKSDAAYADVVLEPEVGPIGLLDFGSIPLCMEMGYDCARKRMDEIKRMAEQSEKATEPAYLDLFRGTDAESGELPRN